MLALFAALTMFFTTTIVTGDIPGAGAVGSATAPPMRAVYHMTPPSGWLSDPQRPIYLNGKYNLYYLHSNQDNGPGGL